MTNQTRQDGYYWVKPSKMDWIMAYSTDGYFHDLSEIQSSLGYLLGDNDEIDETPIERKPKQDYPLSATSSIVTTSGMAGYSWGML